MKLTAIAFPAALLLGCSSHSTIPQVAAPATPSVAVPTMDTLARRVGTNGDDCRVIRSIDGRTVCATQDRLRVNSSKPSHTRMPARLAELPAVLDLTGGDYVVIGSFENLANATEWARFNADFGTDVHPVKGSQPPMYRVVVGPLNGEDSQLVRAVLDGVGVADSWELSLCNREQPSADASCSPQIVAAPSLNPGDPLAQLEAPN